MPTNLRIATLLLAFLTAWPGGLRGAESVRESARQIPVARRVDVVVVGGSTWAVAAALGARERGVDVFLAAPRPYLGEDLCATLRLSLAEGQTPDDPLARAIFGHGRTTTPLAVKKALDKALVDAGVEFLFGCYPTDVLRDADGRPCGIVMANRAGRQAVVAKVIIDATERATVARLAGARCRPWEPGEYEFTRVVIQRDAAGTKSVSQTLKIPMPDGSFRSFAAAEQIAREKTYGDNLLRGAESLFLVPPDPIVGQVDAMKWNAQRPDLGHFRPRGVDRLYAISGQSDMPRDVARQLLRPAALVRLGHRIGSAAGLEAQRPAPRGVHVPGEKIETEVPGDVKEVLTGLRAVDPPKDNVPAEAGGLPVWGRYDVVVIGGGTAGAPAAIGAARRGAKTLVVEYQEGLGGIGTVGLIGRPYHGLDIGFTREVPFPDAKTSIEAKMEWYRREIAKAGGEIWLGALGCGALVEGNRVRGAVVATPQGRCVVLARVVIDATGNADVAAAAGARTVYGDESGGIALQGTGLPTRPLTKSHVNSDYLLVDEDDMLDVWNALVGTRRAMADSEYDAGTLIQNRERRRIVGDWTLRYLDQVLGRTYPDTICYSSSDYDAHGYPSGPYFALMPHDAKSRKANHPAVGAASFTPYRCLLPQGLEGILVVGLGISMERDASALVRMQRDLQNQGYAAGVAGAMAAADDLLTRSVDVKALQRHLVEIGNLPKEVLTAGDNFPLDEARIAEAVKRVVDPNRLVAAKALAVVLAFPEQSRPTLQQAYAAANGEDRVTYAKILGVLGDKEVVPTLVDALRAVKAWDAKIFQGNMAEYAHLPTPIDGLVWALGYTGDRRAVAPIVEKMETLDATSPLSHHRAVALALERIGDPSAAPALARLLSKPDMQGHAMLALEPLSSDRDKRRREGSLREIMLARALYHCGDQDGLGEKILRQYQHDLRGLFAEHATAVLEKK